MYVRERGRVRQTNKGSDRQKWGGRERVRERQMQRETEIEAVIDKSREWQRQRES